MTSLREFGSKLRGLFRKRSLDNQLEEEINEHLDLLIEENIRRGMSPQKAHLAARQDFGAVEQVKETYRERRGLPMLESFLQDLRYGARTLRKNPGFTVVAILTLALGIGSSTAIFSVVNTLLLRPLPFADSSRLVILQEAVPKIVPGKFPVSAPDVADFRRINHVFEDLGAFSSLTMDLSGSGSPVRVHAARTSAAVFRLLGTAPAIGRTFTEDEDQSGHNIVILAYAIWQTQYGGDAGIIGRKVLLNRQPYSVIGVMPRNFEFPSQGLSFFTPAQVYVPIALNPFELSNRGDNFDFGVLAKLRRGVSLSAANADMMIAASQVQQLYPPEARGNIILEASVTPLNDLIVGPTKTLLLLLLGAVGLLLLIACANVANLLLARGAERQKEIAVRVALGAGRFRLIRQLLVESSLLGILGGAVGLFLAYAGLKGLVILAEQILPRAQEISLDPYVLLFALGISILSGLLFGTIPAFATTRTDLSETLKEGGRSASATRSQHRIRDAFVIAQIALAMLLVVGSGLLIRSFVRARETNPGFRSENLISLSIALPTSEYKQQSQAQTFYDRLITQTHSLPGVVSVGISSDLPLNSTWTHLFTPEGHESEQKTGVPANSHTLVDADYFQTLGIPLIRGRFFNEAEMRGRDSAVIISEGMAKRYWPGEDPVGRRLKWGNAVAQNPWITIVGVVGDMKQGPLDAETRPHTYEPFMHICTGPFAFGLCTDRNILVRTQASPDSIVPAIRNIVRQLDSEQPIGKVIAIDALLAASLAPRRFNTFLLAVFATGALALAAIGVYGLLAYNISQQTRELGLRLALGAQPSDILRMVLGKGLRLAAIGLAIGIAAALGLTRLMDTLLYNVTATDPVTFAGVAALLILVALAACWIPARRAMRIDPADALRYE